MALKDGTTICGRHARKTAVSEIYIFELHKRDDHLDIPHLHPDDSTKMIHVKSVIMSTAASAELALDQDLALVSYRLCLQAREIQIGKLQQMAQGADHIFQDPHGNPTLSVKAGEGTYVFQCTKVPTILRASTECCQELAVSVNGQDLYMKGLTKRLTHHCTARACSSTLPAVFNLGSVDSPNWVNVGSSGVPHPAPVPAKFTQEDVFLRVGVPVISDSGLYTEEQREEMMLQAQRQDAILQVVAHLTHTVVSQANMWGNTYDPNSPAGKFQSLIERTTSPFPYSAISIIPISLRIIATIVFFTVTFFCVILPIFKLIKNCLDSTPDWSETLRTFFTPTSLQIMTIRRQIRTFAGLAADQPATVGAPPMLMIGQDDVSTQIRDIRARLAVLEAVAGSRRQLPHNPAVYSPNSQPSAPTA